MQNDSIVSDDSRNLQALGDQPQDFSKLKVLHTMTCNMKLLTTETDWTVRAHL